MAENEEVKEKLLKKLKGRKRRLTAVGRLCVLAETPEYKPVPSVMIRVVGKLTREEIIEMLERFVLKPKENYRFRSLLIQGKWFVEQMEYVSKEQYLGNLKFHDVEKLNDVWKLATTISQKEFNWNLPPWELHVMYIKEVNQTGMYWKTHHVIGDGASISFILMSMADNFGDYVNDQKIKFAKQIKMMNNPCLRLCRKVGIFASLIPATFLTIGNSLKTEPKILEDCKWFQEGKLKTEMSKKGKGHGRDYVTCHKKVYHSDTFRCYSMKSLNKIRRKFKKKCTLNDFFIGLISLGVTSFFKLKKKYTVRMSMPISVRTGMPTGPSNEFGVAIAPVPLGVGYKNFEDRLKIVSKGTRAMKSTNYHQLFYYGARVLSDWCVKKAIGNIARDFHTFTMSNVPGPERVLKMKGKDCAGFSFFAPSNGTILNFSVSSYNGYFYVAVCSDQNIVTEPWKVLDALKEQYFLIAKKYGVELEEIELDKKKKKKKKKEEKKDEVVEKVAGSGSEGVTQRKTDEIEVEIKEE